MKKLYYSLVLFFVAGIFSSCAVGTYVPHAVNLTGTQTTVVLDKANFRVVRNVEAVIEVDNDRLRRTDVEKSAFAELTRKYPLTGSQAYINVVFDEVQREKVFAFHTGRYALKQYVAVRATIIEFLQDNGQPIQSVASPYNAAPQRTVSVEQSNSKVEVVSESQQSSTDNIVQKEESYSIEQLAQLKENKFYIAYLFSSHKLNKDKELLQLFKWQEINALANKFSVSELRKKSANHSIEFEKYEIK